MTENDLGGLRIRLLEMLRFLILFLKLAKVEDFLWF